MPFPIWQSHVACSGLQDSSAVVKHLYEKRSGADRLLQIACVIFPMGLFYFPDVRQLSALYNKSSGLTYSQLYSWDSLPIFDVNHHLIFWGAEGVGVVGEREGLQRMSCRAARRMGCSLPKKTASNAGYSFYWDIWFPSWLNSFYYFFTVFHVS